MMNVKKMTLMGLGVLIILGTVILGGKAIIESPDRQAEEERKLSEMVFLEEPSVLSENEGKTVVIYGNLDAGSDTYDDEYDISFSHPIVRRIKYKYEYEREEVDDTGRKKSSGEEITYEASWKKAGTTLLAETAKLGDFTIEKQYIERLKSYQSVPEEELQETVLQDYFSFNVEGNTVYTPDRVPIASVKHQKWKKEGYEGFGYEYLDTSKTVTFVGVQNGNRIEPVDNNMENSVYEKQMTYQDFEEKIEASGVYTYVGIAMFLVLGMILLLAGLKMKA